jgi:molybdopterin-guanine dinucleotide biosynthesis protein A
MLKITAFYGQVSLRFVEREEIARFDPEGRSFVNVNTPDDLAAQQA